MRSILLVLIISTVFLLSIWIGVNTKEVVHKQLIKDYSDVPLAKYTLQEWEDLGVNVWKKYYTPERWKELEAKYSLIDSYESRWKDNLDFVLERNQEKGLVIDKNDIEIWAKPLREEILPIKRWGWFDDFKYRTLQCEYYIMYNNKELRSYPLHLPPTEGNMVQKGN